MGSKIKNLKRNHLVIYTSAEAFNKDFSQFKLPQIPIVECAFENNCVAVVQDISRATSKNPDRNHVLHIFWSSIDLIRFINKKK